MTFAVQATRVSKWYGRVAALQDVSLYIEPGIWGLLGPNGSGKTTFMRLVSGDLRPSIGTIHIAGQSPFANPDVLRRIGACPEADAMFDELTGLEHVTFLARLSGIDPGAAEKRAGAMLDKLGLAEARNRRVGGYSRGMRQRVKLAQALVHEPDVLLLDEPLTGTDPLSRQLILDCVRERADKGAIVLFSTHVLPEVEALTDRVLLIARGQVVAQGTTAEIRAVLDDHPQIVRIECVAPRTLAGALAQSPAIDSMRFLGTDTLEVATLDPDRAYQAIAEAISSSSIGLRSLTSPELGIDALFHHLVQRSGRLAGSGADRGSGGRRPDAPQAGAAR